MDGQIASQLSKLLQQIQIDIDDHIVGIVGTVGIVGIVGTVDIVGIVGRVGIVGTVGTARKISGQIDTEIDVNVDIQAERDGGKYVDTQIQDDTST